MSWVAVQLDWGAESKTLLFRQRGEGWRIFWARWIHSVLDPAVRLLRFTCFEFSKYFSIFKH